MNRVKLTVLVCALGYFVDIYDLVLFGIVRVQSLKAIGIPEDRILDVGVMLLNLQMGGMLIGGLLWGILGDKKGRLSVLFGSIFLYSICNFLNAFVVNEFQYGVLRFLAGVGLAGELGAAITLVSEVTDKSNRGIAATIVASVGVSGAVLAGIIGEVFDWKVAYMIGGVLGFLLLILRANVLESGMYEKTKSAGHFDGNQFLKILFAAKNLKKYLWCISIGVPIWYVIGVLVMFSPEIAKSLGLEEPISAGRAILFTYVGLIIGDVASGLLSQKLKSRRKSVFAFLVLTALSIVLYFLAPMKTANEFYGLCVLMGTGAGYWVIFVTIAAEQFGTNVRSTVTTTVPNFVRGAVVPLTLLFQAGKGHFGILGSAGLVGVCCFVLAFFALSKLQETFSKDLDYLETINKS
jgi:putative MFS transporter